MWEAIGPLGFLDNNRIVVTFVTRHVSEALPRRGVPNESLPLRLHALFVDAKTGLLHTTLEWPTASERSRISPGPAGKFVVITPDKLMQYSPGFQLIRELPVPISGEALRDAWQALRSPSGKYLLFDYQLRATDGHGPTLSDFEVRVLWVNGEKLKLVLSLKDQGRKSISPVSISDDGMVLLMGGKIGKPEGPFNWPCDPLKDFPRTDYCRADRFIDNQILLARDHHSVPRRWMYFVGTNGELLFSEKYPKGDVFYEATSADGRRLAVAAYKGKGGIAFLDISPHYVLRSISVYDIPTRRWVYTLDAKKQKIKLDPVRREFALSPDGSLLGVITEDGVLNVYRLPETPAAPPGQ